MELKNLIVETEEILSSFYAVELPYSAVNFLFVTEVESLKIPADDKNKLALTLFEKTGDDFFIGVYFSKILQERLLHTHATFTVAQISDIVCVFEEVSHFHHVLHALQHHYQISLLELEYLAELEKFSILCEFLQRRFHADFAETIFHLFFRHCTFLPNSDQDRYMAATMQARLKIQSIFSGNNRGSPRHYRESFRQEYFRKLRAS